VVGLLKSSLVSRRKSLTVITPGISVVYTIATLSNKLFEITSLLLFETIWPTFLIYHAQLENTNSIQTTSKTVILLIFQLQQVLLWIDCLETMKCKTQLNSFDQMKVNSSIPVLNSIFWGCEVRHVLHTFHLFMHNSTLEFNGHTLAAMTL